MLFGIKYDSFATRSHICNLLVVILATLLEIISVIRFKPECPYKSMITNQHFCSSHPCQPAEPTTLSDVSRSEIQDGVEMEAAAKTKESSEERREGTIAANEEKSEMLILSSIITGQSAKSPGRPSLIRCERARYG
jgi:hypothetical protein